MFSLTMWHSACLLNESDNKESIPPTPTAKTVGFFLKTDSDGTRFMNFGRLSRSNIASLFVLSLAVSILVLLPVTANASRVAVLPFSFPTDDKSLEKFSEHVTKTLRASISSMSSGPILESEADIRSVVENNPNFKNDGQALKIASLLPADLAVFGFLSREGDRYYMRAVMWDLKSPRLVVSTEHRVSNIHELPGVLEVFANAVNRRLQGSPHLPFYRSDTGAETAGAGRIPRLVDVNRNPGPWRSPDISAALSGLDIGNIVGERKNETIFLDDGGITISRFEEGGLKQLTQYSQFGATHLSVEIEDVDGDGVSEIILCYQTTLGIESCLIQYLNRNFQVIGRTPGVILRSVVDPHTNSRILVGQRMASTNMFSGEMTKYEVADGKLRESGKLRLPPGTLLLSYDSGYVGKEKQFIQAILNQDQRLMLFDKDNRPLQVINDKLYGSSRKIKISVEDKEKEITLPGRVLIGDIKGDGRKEVLVVKTTDGSSVIQALGWDGQSLTEQWKTIRSLGVITDFRMGDFKNEGTRSLVLILLKPNYLLFMSPQSVIFAYDFSY